MKANIKLLHGVQLRAGSQSGAAGAVLAEVWLGRGADRRGEYLEQRVNFGTADDQRR